MEERSEEEGPLPTVTVSLGGALRQLRAARDLTQSRLARLSKVKRSLISAYEADKIVPDASTLGRLLQAMSFQWGAIDRATSFLSGLVSEESSQKPAGSLSDRDALLRAAEEEVSEVRLRAAVLLRSTARVSDLLCHLRGTGTEESTDKKEKDRALAGQLFAELRSLPVKAQYQRIKEGPQFGNWALCELYCLESQQACSRDVSQAATLADLAVRVAEKVRGDAAWQKKLLGFAYGHVANVLRVRSDFRAASRMFKKAREFWEEGGRSSQGYLEEGLLDALEASLRRDERNFPEALALLECAATNAVGKRLRVQVAISRAKLVHETGDLGRAALILEEIPEEDLPAGDDKLVLCIRHNRMDYLSKLDRFEEAQALLPTVRMLSRRAGGELDRVRLLWTEGRIDAGLGHVEQGLEKLTRARGHFSSQSMDYDTALVSLEMAVLYAKEGRAGEVKTLARYMVPIFQSKKVHREAIAALVLFRQVAEREAATEELVRSVLRFLRRARYQPELKFEGLAA